MRVRILFVVYDDKSQKKLQKTSKISSSKILFSCFCIFAIFIFGG